MCLRASVTTPADSPERCRSSDPRDGGLPHFSGGSASALPVSGPARRSLAFRPADSPSRPRRPSTPKASTDSLPPPPLRLLPAGATSCRVGIAPTERRRLSRHTEKSGLGARGSHAIFPGRPPGRARHSARAAYGRAPPQLAPALRESDARFPRHEVSSPGSSTPVLRSCRRQKSSNIRPRQSFAPRAAPPSSHSSFEENMLEPSWSRRPT